MSPGPRAKREAKRYLSRLAKLTGRAKLDTATCREAAKQEQVEEWALTLRASRGGVNGHSVSEGSNGQRSREGLTGKPRSTARAEQTEGTQAEPSREEGANAR
jgi:hypothetical protein